MNTKLLISVLLLFVTGPIFTQKSFRVIRYKPIILYYENNVLKGNMPPNFVIKPINDIEIKKGGMAYVSNPENHTVKLLEGGVRYSYTDIKNIFNKQESILTQVINFFGIQAQSYDQSLRKYAKENMKDVLAGSSRDVSTLMKYPPNGILLLQDSLRFVLNEKMVGNAECRLQLYTNTESNEQILLDTLYLKDVLYQFKGTKQNRGSNTRLYWKSAPTTSDLDKFQPHYFELASKSKQKEIANTVRKIVRSKATDEEDKLLLLASFYEDEKLFYEANNTYLKLLKVKDSNDYKGLYTLFLASYNIFLDGN
jgi:hypothetical protein